MFPWFNRRLGCGIVAGQAWYYVLVKAGKMLTTTTCYFLVQLFLPWPRLPRGVSINFQERKSLGALQNEKFFKGKLFRPACLFKVRRAWNTGQLLKGGVVEKKLRTTGLARMIKPGL